MKDLNSIYFKTLIGTVLGAAILTIIQIWTPIIGWDTYLKLIGTLTIIFVLVGFLMALRSDFKSDKKLKDDNYLD